MYVRMRCIYVMHAVYVTCNVRQGTVLYRGVNGNANANGMVNGSANRSRKTNKLGHFKMILA